MSSSQKPRTFKFRPIIEAAPSLKRLLIIFVFVYYPTDYLASLSSRKYTFTFPWEQSIPYIPEMYFIYYAIFALPLFTALIVDNKKQFQLITRRCITAILVAGVFFICVPTDSILKKPDSDSYVEKMTAIVAGSYNYLPSLHVLLTLIFATGLLNKLGWKTFPPIVVGTVTLMASTLFTFQHQVADIIASFAIYVPIVLFVNENNNLLGGEHDKSIDKTQRPP